MGSETLPTEPDEPEEAGTVPEHQLDKLGHAFVRRARAQGRVKDDYSHPKDSDAECAECGAALPHVEWQYEEDGDIVCSDHTEKTTFRGSPP